MTEKEFYKELLIDKSKRVETLVKKAKDILGIDKETGEPIILVSRARLRDEDYIALYMIGKFVASELGLSESPCVTYTEVANRTGIKREIVAARLSDLKKKGYVRSPRRGEHEIVFPRISDILDEVRQRVGLN